MATQTRKLEAIEFDGSNNPEPLYTEPEFSNGNDNGGSGYPGSNADSTGTAASDGSGEPITEPVKRRRRRRTATSTPESIASPVHSPAQLRGIVKSLTITFKHGFGGIAKLRTMAMGFIPDPTSPTGILMKRDSDGNTVPVGAGDCWLIDDKDAKELAEAWTAVIELYAPPELVHKSATISGAITTTAMVFLTRAIADIQTQVMLQQMREATAAMMPNASGLPGMSSNGMVPDTEYAPAP